MTLRGNVGHLGDLPSEKKIAKSTSKAAKNAKVAKDASQTNGTVGDLPGSRTPPESRQAGSGRPGRATPQQLTIGDQLRWARRRAERLVQAMADQDGAAAAQERPGDAERDRAAQHRARIENALRAFYERQRAPGSKAR